MNLETSYQRGSQPKERRPHSLEKKNKRRVILMGIRAKSTSNQRMKRMANLNRLISPAWRSTSLVGKTLVQNCGESVSSSGKLRVTHLLVLAERDLQVDAKQRQVSAREQGVP
jgi:hypothetical protein